MAYPATIETAKRRFDSVAAQLKRTTEVNRLASEAGPVTANAILGYLDTLRGYYAEMQEIAAVPGIGAAYPNIATEAAAVMSTTLATIQWIAVNFPKENGYLAAQTVDLTTGEVTWRSLSTAALANLRVEIASLEATVE
jgi:hypothetical protein